MSVDESQILDSCRDLWDITLGLRLSNESPASEPDEESLKSYVNVSGDWQGAVVLECSTSVVRHAAAMMFGSDGDDADSKDLQQALNELTRLVGKRIQKHLPSAGKLSAPRALGGTDLETMQGVSELALNCEGRPVRIAVLENAAISV